ncbi:MAG: hypothetical protein U0Q16_03900 [Bryobacteraceae bacterium]
MDRRLEIGVAQQRSEGRQIRAILQLMGRETVTQQRDRPVW